MLYLLAIIASYIQSTVGFGLGLITMAGVGIFNLLPLNDAAAMVSVFGVVSSSIALYGDHHLIEKRIYLSLLLFSLPGLLIGYFFLFEYGDDAARLCKIVLGLIVAISAISLAITPKVREKSSSVSRFGVFGFLAGLLGGFTSTAGPPLVYVLNSEPISFKKARAHLLLTFASLSILRLIIFLFSVSPTAGWYNQTGLTLVAVTLGASASKIITFPFSDNGMRRLSYILLVVLSLFLIFPNII